MTARFSFRYDVDYLMTAFDRHRAQSWSRHVSKAVLVVALVLVAAYVYQSFERSDSKGAIVGIALFVAVFMSRRLLRGLVRRRMSRMPGLGDGFVIELSPRGMYAKGQGQEATLGWDHFQRALRFTDGFLLMQSNRAFNWLPLDALSAPGTADEVHSLIESALGRVEVVPR